ncbi:MAG: adenylyl-sulfate kinase [Epsilonproteobacteria bacterium]|nr:adenylyl-sulfate kinase [Campylobacterota bacterium]
MVIWLLGISGSGKTTLAKELKKHFDKIHQKSYIIDGDLIRDFFDRDLGYSKEERIANIKRVLISAKVLEDNGIIPIVANISPFQELRDFAKQKFQNYVEIYLKRDIDTITNKDFVYSDKNVIGVDMEFDEPTNPDLVIDTSKKSINESLKEILEIIEIKTNKFDSWNEIKKQTDNIQRKITIKPREIYWVKVGYNIGMEIYGKGDNFARPVIVVKRLTKDLFFGIPLSMQIKQGDYFYTFEYVNKERGLLQNSALLLQAKIFSVKRIMNKSGMINKNDFDEIIKRFNQMIAPS